MRAHTDDRNRGPAPVDLSPGLRAMVTEGLAVPPRAPASPALYADDLPPTPVSGLSDTQFAEWFESGR